MQRRPARWMAAYTKRDSRRRVWRKIVQTMACIVVFCTTYALILPAITLEQQYTCGLEAHTHEESCYTQRILTEVNCSAETLGVHRHTESCYGENGELTCTLPDHVRHTHESVCFDAQGQLVCPLEERSESSFPDVLSHQHSEGCLVAVSQERVLSCTVEEHVHTDSCLVDLKSDLETAEDWEQTFSQVSRTGNWLDDLLALAKSQLGYGESVTNYISEDGTARQGYTRYGAWYGTPYGSWDTLFVSFCLHYAGIPQEAVPPESNSQRWMAQLEELGLLNYMESREPAIGEVVFYTSGGGELRCGIVSAIDRQMNAETGREEIAQLRIIAGDLDNRVGELGVPAADVLASCSMERARLRYEAMQAEEAAETTESTEPVEPTVSAETTGPVETTEAAQTTAPAETAEPAALLSQTAETENYIVTVSYSTSLALPEDAELRVVEHSKDSEIFHQRCAQAGYELEWLLNIGFFQGETELDLDGQFDVVVTSKQGTSLSGDITHFDGQTPERISGTAEEDASVAFTSDGFSDFGGVALAAARATTVTYQFTTANPASLQEGVDYAVYFGTNNNYTFLTTTNYIDARQVNGAQYWSSPYIIGNSWELSADQMGTTNLSHIAWRVVREGQYYYLQSQKDGQRITIADSLWMSNGSWLKNVDTNGAGTKLEAEWYGAINYLRYNNGWTRTNSRNEATTMYFARVTQTTEGGDDEPVTPPTPTVPSYPYHPHAVHTGEVNISRLRFFNICENGDSGVSALAGCVFEIKDANGNVYATVTSGDSPEVPLPEGIPDGTYTITEVSAPEGYLRDTNHTRTFTIQGGNLVSDRNIGTFINHDLEQMTAGKTAEVEDYNNRIYQILLNAESHMRHYQMDPVDVLFVVDQSNSMLFPSGLEPVAGKQVTLHFTDTGNDWDNNNKTKVPANTNNMEALGLDKNEIYYIISDPHGTSTVWAVWYNGQGWMYQDASYYAKAKHNNVPGYQDPNERAIFPENRSYSDQKGAEASGTRSNGGGLGFDLAGGGLGNYVNSQGGQATFQIYQATGEYNRLHYLEEALTNMIYELADVNSKNRVTLTGFTKEVNPANDIGPLELTPDNVSTLVNSVTSINTGGGTRQDIALNHVYTNHLNDDSEHYSEDPNDNYTILITDGAPVRSGSSAPDLGGANDTASTADNATIYARIKGFAEQVRSKSSLMTVSLGMDDVEAGKDVLGQIASGDDFFCALDDAQDLVKNIQKLLFDGFKPKELIPMTGDVVDEISDSFYPIAWTAPGDGTAAGRQVLVSDTGKDWILLQTNDWITLDGGYTTAGAPDAAGQLLQKDDGTFYVQWENALLSYPDKEHPLKNINSQGVAWVNQGSGANTGRTVLGTYDGKDWILLNNGDWISSQGRYYSGTPSGWDQRNYGQYNNGNVNWGWAANGGNNRIPFDHTRIPFNADGGQWEGTVYVKAKEDFIGGNAIDTNKKASVTTDHATKNFSVPTVNVRLLDMNEMSSEVTVYLGDTINPIYGTDSEGNTVVVGESPVDSLKGFYEETRFTKLIGDSGDVLNKITVGENGSDGLEDALFYLRYAMGRDLTEDEWTSLVNGNTITVEYTYDYPSSHGPVGYFTFSLEKTGTGSDYAAHEATAACQPEGNPLTESCESPAETYTLNVTYTAYRLGEAGRPAQNVYNDTQGPGTEVGTGQTLETGLGVVDKDNVHEVHVISGAIQVTKRFADGVVPETEQTFWFNLHRMEDGEDTSGDLTKSVTLQTGTAAIRFEGLKRGTYVLTELPHEIYMVDTMTVLDSTNCQSDPAIGGSAGTLTFVMGNNIPGENVIGLADSGDSYTSYIDPVNGVFAAAEIINKEIVYSGDIPVEKIWDDGPETHTEDAVYVLLYLDGAPVVDSDGHGRLLRLDAANNWKGAFEVALADEEDSVNNYNYSVREVSQVSDEEMYQWPTALLEGDKTLLYYGKVLEQGNIFGVNGSGYMVGYETAEDGTLVVRNNRALDLPSTGGMGTHMYTFSGLSALLTALMYGCSQRRKRERGASR